MKRLFNISVLLFALLFLILFSNYSQERDWEKYLIEDVENINPVYKPVVGIAMGYLNFYGNVKNNISNPLNGSMALKINMHAFVDQAKHYKFNVYVMTTYITQTPLTVNQRSFTIPSKNFNFQTDFLIFGANIHYDFDHFIKKNSFVRPFISIGVEDVSFNSKANLFGKYFDGAAWHDNVRYYYWTDGTVRNRPQSDERQSYFMGRDNSYETDMRSDTSLNNLGSYSQNTFAIPVEVGLDFNITNRTSIRLGYAYNFTFSKYIDYNKNITLNPGFDKFGYTYVSLHFDLFSDPKMLRLNRLLAMVEDNDIDVMFGDDDNDGVPDAIDKCPNTPKGVLVDSVGCPFDKDGDGVPDYLDKDNNSAPGAIVDQDGVEIPDANVWEVLSQEALPRPQVEMYLSLMNNLASGSGRKFGKAEIPPKFKALDLDGDGYISFDEVIKAIDAFFDFDSDLSTDDIYELNDFFFSQ